MKYIYLVLTIVAIIFMLSCKNETKQIDKIQKKIEKPDLNNRLVTKEEAKELFDTAMKFLETNGKEKAFKAFNDSNGKFVKKDLYCFCLDFDKNWVVMGANPSLVGKSAVSMRDLKGKDFVEEFLQIAKTKGFGTSSYTYKNPITGLEQLKTSFIQKVSDNEFCGMGYYNK